MKNHIAIVGAGNGGQAFAGYLSLMGERIKIFDVIPATVEKLNEVGGCFDGRQQKTDWLLLRY